MDGFDFSKKGLTPTAPGSKAQSIVAEFHINTDNQKAKVRPLDIEVGLLKKIKKANVAKGASRTIGILVNNASDRSQPSIEEPIQEE